METRFVKNFLFPREVIYCASLRNYGFCWGARKFENGSFALKVAEGVDLYDALGQKVETQIEDVFVFSNGYRLQKQTASSGWYLLRSDGEHVLYGEKVEVCDETLFGLKVDDCLWEIYQFFNGNNLRLLTKCRAENVKLFRKEGNSNFVTVLENQNGVELQFRDGCTGVIMQDLPKSNFFFSLFDGRFAVSEKQLSVKEHTAGCLLLEAAKRATLDLYDDKLQMNASGVVGIAVFGNGMYLLNKKEEWKLFSADDKLLRDKIYHLTIYDEQNLRQCILFACTEQDKRVVIRLKDNGWLHLTYGNELEFLTPNGQRVVAEDGCNEPILF